MAIKTAFVDAIDDVFLVTALITALAAIPAFFLKGSVAEMRERSLARIAWRESFGHGASSSIALTPVIELEKKLRRTLLGISDSYS
jgi:hypothetical protein